MTAAAPKLELALELALARARDIAGAVPDPELPMLTLGDLGILREVTVDDAGVVVWITPTYSGCPALREMSRDVAARLAAAGLGDVEVRTSLSPPWSTDWITRPAAASWPRPGSRPPARPRSGPRPGAADAHRRPGLGALPGLRVPRHRAHRGVRRHRLQGPVPLPGLRGALRACQGTLKCRQRVNGGCLSNSPWAASTGCVTMPRPSPSTFRRSTPSCSGSGPASRSPCAG